LGLNSGRQNAEGGFTRLTGGRSFSAEGLQAEDDDLLMAMARELVTEKGFGQNAQAVWRAIQQQNAAITQASPTISGVELQPICAPSVIPLPAQEPLSEAVNQLLLFGASLAASSGHKRAARRPPATAPSAAAQLPLF
jgi:hypothetical protein